MAETTQPLVESLQPNNPLGKLRGAAMRGGIWLIGGYGIRQILRFGNNIILAYLLAPEMFGTMQLINVVILGLTLFSDVGINLNIMQSKRGTDPSFLDTAWTVQVLRGLLLGILASALAMPMARLYPQHTSLIYVLPVAALIPVFQGFFSVKKATANRDLQLRELMLIEVGSYFVGILTMIGYAVYIESSIWALVLGTLVTAFLEMIFSHTVLKGYNPSLRWDQAAFTELYKFGRWILISTSLTFLITQSDRLIIGKWLPPALFGVFGVAVMFARMAEEVIRQVATRILLPSYAELENNNPAGLYQTVRQSRLLLVGLAWAAALFFIVFGPQFIEFVYDDRYLDAGWMLRILAFGPLISVLGISYDIVFITKGKTSSLAILSLIQFVILLSAIFVGNYLDDLRGILIGLAMVPWLIFPAKALFARRLKLFQPEVDFPVILGASLIALVTYIML